MKLVNQPFTIDATWLDSFCIGIRHISKITTSSILNSGNVLQSHSFTSSTVLLPRSLMINNHTWSFLVIKPKIVGKQKELIFETLPAQLSWLFQNFWPIPKKLHKISASTTKATQQNVWICPDARTQLLQNLGYKTGKQKSLLQFAQLLCN